MRMKTRACAVMGATAALVVTGALPSTARTVVDRVDSFYGGYFYDNVATGTGLPDLILFADASPEDRCNGAPVPFVERGRVFGEPPNGGAREHYSFVKRAPLWLYNGEGMSAPEFVGAYCAAVDDPDVPVPEPVGVGKGFVQGQISVEWRDAGPPDAAETNSARGSVKTPDGERLVVRGEAEIALTAPGVGVPVDVSVQVLNR